MRTKAKDLSLSLSAGLKIQGGICQENEDGSTTITPEISQVTPGSVADHCGQLQIGRRSLFDPLPGISLLSSGSNPGVEWTETNESP